MDVLPDMALMRAKDRNRINMRFPRRYYSMEKLMIELGGDAIRVDAPDIREFIDARHARNVAKAARYGNQVPMSPARYQRILEDRTWEEMLCTGEGMRRNVSALWLFNRRRDRRCHRNRGRQPLPGRPQA